MSSLPRRVFLDWSHPPLARAAAWLAEEHGADLSGLVVAVPGARAARRLREQLARALGPAWHPPRLLTAGAVTDAFVQLQRPVADRLVRTLAWMHALRDLPADVQRRLIARPPEPGDLSAWLRLGNEVRALFGEVAAEGRDFGVVRDGLADASPGERTRWDTLVAAQAAMVARLDRHGLVDPHLARRDAIDAGAFDHDSGLVLVGVSDAPGLVRRLVEQLGDRATALVFAPEQHAERFDAGGCVEPDAWSGAQVSLDVARWHVADQPADQARKTELIVAGWDGRFAADEITVGVADAEVVPYLQRRFAAHGVDARDAGGTPVSRTPPVRLLAAVERWLRTRSFADLAALLRHPHLEARLRRHELLKGHSPAELLDKYHEEHLPARVDGAWLADASERRERDLADRLSALYAALGSVLGPLAGEKGRSADAWVPGLREFLLAVYGQGHLDPDDEPQRVLAGALEALVDTLGALEALPPDIAPVLSGAEVLHLLLDAVGSRSIAPRAATPGRPTVELLGWLELPLDDAPALVVTGFSEGRVPAAPSGDAWLPDSVRQRLGLVDDSRRLARDLHALELMLQSRRAMALVSGRRTGDGDPLLPSRLAFHVPDERIVEHVRHAIPQDQSGRVEDADRSAEAPGFGPVVRSGRTEPRSWSPTSFRTYLQSPYLFYLQRIERLNSLDDRARELDGRTFGSLAHTVLEAFGNCAEVRDSSDAAVIGDWLEGNLRDLAAGRFASVAYPAVGLQIERLAWRLRTFAQVQALRAAEGWRIHAVEWTPDEDGVLFEVGDGPAVTMRGRMDRIDHHPELGWAILDYKTGERVGDPARTHRDKNGAWVDLQLPMYAWLAGSIVGSEPPALGYVSIPAQTDEVKFDLVQPSWDAEALRDAWDTARRVVRDVRAGRFTELGDARPFDMMFKALCGKGLMAQQLAPVRTVAGPQRAEPGAATSKPPAKRAKREPSAPADGPGLFDSGDSP